MINLELRIECELCAAAVVVKPELRFTRHGSEFMDGPFEDSAFVRAPENWSLAGGPERVTCPDCLHKHRVFDGLLRLREFCQDEELRAQLEACIQGLKVPGREAVLA